MATADGQRRDFCGGNRGIRSLLAFGLIFALLYAPTRLIQEANPEWRLVSWLLALEVVGLTLLALPLVDRFRCSSALSISGVRFSAFPFLFFLVAVPWPTVVENPVIRGLTAAVTAATAEILGLLDIPSVLHGNVIEVGRGMVGIDEACSGIRSFQASFMIALFFGEVYGLKLARRCYCILAGFVLSLQFNLLRTTLLAFIAARKGLVATASWHDPAGASILVSCFFGLWLLAFWLRSSDHEVVLGPQASGLTPAFGSAGYFSLHSRLLVLVPSVLASWLGLVECATEIWYRVHEQRLAAPNSWHIELRGEQASLRELPFPPNTRQFLRFDEGLNTTWQEGVGLTWQAIYLRWHPGRVAIHLAKNHTPEDCLIAAGHELLAQSVLPPISVRGLELPFRSYLVRDERGLAYVFYCLWEDRAAQHLFDAKWLSYRNRLVPVLAGQRNSGQRSLELALWGADNNQEAETALREVLNRIIKLDD